MQELRTFTSPRDSNHAFNGVCSRISNLSIEPVVVRSVVFGGEVGTFSVWVCAHPRVAEPWTSADLWTLCGSGHGSPSFEHRCDLEEPFLVAPGQDVWLYVHSSLQHDRGIAYQSFGSRESCIAADRNLCMLPGAARLGHTPFGAQTGFFRKNRGFSGALCYDTQRLPWSVMDHRQFPKQFRKCIFAVLLCHNSSDGLLHHLPFEVLLLILEQLYWRDFCKTETDDEEDDEKEETESESELLRELRQRRRRRRNRGCFASCWGAMMRRLGY